MRLPPSTVERSTPPAAAGSSTSPAGNSARRAVVRRAAAAAALLALVALAFGGTLRNGFVYDDQFLVVENPLLERPSSWPELFRSDSWAAAGLDTRNYRPLPLLTIALNRFWGGLEPAGFHLVNLLLHALAAGLLLALGRRLGLGWPAASLAAALFAVHPLQTESVSEIVGRMDLMAGAALLGALLAHLELRRRQSASRPAWAPAAGALLLYAAALLSKEHVVLFPVVAAIWDLQTRRGPSRRWLPIHVAYAVVATAYLALRAAVFDGELLAGRISPLDNPLAHVDPALRVVSALGVAARYLAHALAPVGLSPDYCYAQILPFDSLLAPVAWLTVGGALVAVFGAVALARRSPRAALPIVLAAAAYLPVSNLLFPIGTVMGDRLFYLPLAGLALLVGLGAERALAARPRAALAIATGIVATLTWGSANQSHHWRDSYTLSTRSVRAAPRCARGHSTLGYNQLDRGELASASASFASALAIYPDYPKAEIGLAMTVLRSSAGPDELARARFRIEHALELDPSSTTALEVAAEIARRLGDLDAARALWLRRLELDPRHAPTLSNLAILEWSAGSSERAILLWRRAAEQPGAPAETWLNLGRALAASGSPEEAEEALRRYRASSGGVAPGPAGGATPPR